MLIEIKLHCSKQSQNFHKQNVVHNIEPNDKLQVIQLDQLESKSKPQQADSNMYSILREA